MLNWIKVQAMYYQNIKLCHWTLGLITLCDISSKENNYVLFSNESMTDNNRSKVLTFQNKDSNFCRSFDVYVGEKFYQENPQISGIDTSTGHDNQKNFYQLQRFKGIPQPKPRNILGNWESLITTFILNISIMIYKS